MKNNNLTILYHIKIKNEAQSKLIVTTFLKFAVLAFYKTTKIIIPLIYKRIKPFISPIHHNLTFCFMAKILNSLFDTKSRSCVKRKKALLVRNQVLIKRRQFNELDMFNHPILI